MDSNITRSARKAKELTKNQFIREMNKQIHTQLQPGKVDKEPLFYLMLLAQSSFDIKDLRNDNNIKYPIAIMYFAAFKLFKYLDLSYVFDLRVKDVGGDYYLSLLSIESHISKIISSFNYILFGIKDEVDTFYLKSELVKLMISLTSLTKSVNINIEKIFYLASEYFKEISPSINLDKCDRLVTKIKTIRELYLSRVEMKKMSNIDNVLRDKFEELIDAN